jgi:hypothetical protein
LVKSQCFYLVLSYRAPKRLVRALVASNHFLILFVLIAMVVYFEMNNFFAVLAVQYFYPCLGSNTDFDREKVFIHSSAMFLAFDQF